MHVFSGYAHDPDPVVGARTCSTRRYHYGGLQPHPEHLGYRKLNHQPIPRDRLPILEKTAHLAKT